MPDEFDPLAILRALERHNVRYVVVGGFAAWMQGVPVVTTDVDIVYDSSPANIEALVVALDELGAIYRHQAGRRLQPQAHGLASTQAAGHHLLQTRCGDLDDLRTASGLEYSELAADTITFEFDDIEVAFAPLSRLVTMKEAAGRPKDIAVLPVLRAALEAADDDS